LRWPSSSSFRSDTCISKAARRPRDHASIVAKAAVDPASKQAPAVADDHCPICALIHLAGTLTPSEAPTLSGLAAFGRVLLLAAIEFEFAAALHHSPLGARAPPLA
jgi:hypothetical protein